MQLLVSFNTNNVSGLSSAVFFFKVDIFFSLVELVSSTELRRSDFETVNHVNLTSFLSWRDDKKQEPIRTSDHSKRTKRWTREART